MPEIPMVNFEHVSMEYKKGGRLALEDINFQAKPGEFVFLLGHSGAGKSTLLKLILREILPTEARSLSTATTLPPSKSARSPTYAGRWGSSFRTSASSPA